jgi:phosphotransferase system  glucose/maltose/N-acetylglucosamine-specific IIC component
VALGSIPSPAKTNQKKKEKEMAKEEGSEWQNIDCCWVYIVGIRVFIVSGFLVFCTFDIFKKEEEEEKEEEEKEEERRKRRAPEEP